MAAKLTTKQAQKLLSILLDCQSEKRLIERFREAFPGLWDDPKAWTVLGGSEDKAAATSAQQKTAEAAAKELVANSFDALLESALAKLPKGVATPKSNREAWELLERHGLMPSPGAVVVFRQADPKGGDDRSGAEIEIPLGEVAFGVMDRGCGQPPGKMRTTFLGVLEGALNKLRLAYLMGRYCAGSTGVHNFAGAEGIKVVVTRTSDPECPWSIALVRYRPKSRSVLEYFAPGGAIPELPAQTLHPLRDAAGRPWLGSKSEREMGALASGTFVKVYSFDMPRLGNTSFAALAAMVDQRFGTLPFPVVCFDSTRGGHYTLEADDRGGADVRLAHGACKWADETACAHPGENFVEFEVKGEAWDGATVKVRAWRLPEDAGLQKRLGSPRAFHLISQQVHCVETKAWLSEWDLAALGDEIVVEIDASDLPEHELGRIFSSDREHINENSVGRDYRAIVGKALNSEGVVLTWAAESRERRKRAALASASGDYDDKFRRWNQASSSASAKANKKKLEALRAEARLAVGGEVSAEGAPAGRGVRKKGVATPLPASSSQSVRAGGAGGVKTKGSRDAGASTQVPGLAKKAKRLPDAKIVRAKRRENGVDQELPPELFAIRAVKAAGDDAVITFFLENAASFGRVAGSEIVFDLEIEGKNGKIIKIDGVSTVWVSASEEDAVDGLELDGRGRRGAANLMIVSVGTVNGRQREGKPTVKIAASHQHALYQARSLGSMVEVIVNVDHPRMVEEAATGAMQEFQDEVVSKVYGFIVGSLGAKQRVSDISPIFKDGRKLASLESQIEALIPILDAMAPAMESMASIDLLRQAEKEGRKASRRGK